MPTRLGRTRFSLSVGAGHSSKHDAYIEQGTMSARGGVGVAEERTAGSSTACVLHGRRSECQVDKSKAPRFSLSTYPLPHQCVSGLVRTRGQQKIVRPLVKASNCCDKPTPRHTLHECEGARTPTCSHAPMFATDAIGKKYAGARGERSSSTVEASRATAATILLGQQAAHNEQILELRSYREGGAGY